MQAEVPSIIPTQVMFSWRDDGDLVVDCLRDGEPWTFALRCTCDEDTTGVAEQLDRWAAESAVVWMSEPIGRGPRRLVLWSGNTCVSLDLAVAGTD